MVVASVVSSAPPARAQTGPSPPARRTGEWTPPYPRPPLARALKRQQMRLEQTRLETLIDRLPISDGMTALDIGSGPGYASFLFAERLHGTGAVFATDIRKDFVDFINEEAQKRHLGNLSAVTVGADGLDEFYSRHRYDLVLLSNVYHCLDKRVAYFSALRSFLNDGATLVLVMYDQVPQFTPDDFIDLEGLASSLWKESPESPFSRELSSTTRQLLPPGGDRETLKTALTADFNRVLTDPVFYRNFYSDFYFEKDLFTAPERDFANWLLMGLEESGALGEPFDRIGPRERRAVMKLNRLFLINRFGEYLAQGGMGAYLPAGDANRHVSKYVMLKELDAAGYSLTEETKLTAYYDAFIMAPKPP